MSGFREGGGTAGTSALGARGPHASATRAKGGMRRKPKNRTSVLAAAESTDRPSCEHVLSLRRRNGLRAVGDVRQPKPENVEDLEEYKPGIKKYQVSLTFSGEAGVVMSELMNKLDVDSPNEVVKFTIALLLSAQGKEILLRDLKSGVVEVVEV